MDRAFRSLRNAIDVSDYFETSGFELRCLTEPIDTTTPFGKFVYQQRNVFAELERNLIRERTIAGMNAARARGAKIGRPRKLSPSQVADAAIKLSTKPPLDRGVLAKQLGVSPITLSRAMRRHAQSRDGSESTQCDRLQVTMQHTS